MDNERALRDVLQRAVTRDEIAALRLGAAKTVVAFRSDSGDDVVVLLDRNPPEITSDGDAEIEIHLSPEQAQQFRQGRLNMPLEAGAGELRCQGPIRKYLVVDAILRAQLRAVNSG